MRFDIEDAILGMYDSIERAREAQADDEWARLKIVYNRTRPRGTGCSRAFRSGSTAGNHVWKAPGSDCSYHS